MKPVADFFKGLMNSRADYATRHHSRAYDRGQLAGNIAILVIPAVLVLSIGIAIGSYF